jgi:molecular chaperone GrpE
MTEKKTNTKQVKTSAKADDSLDTILEEVENLKKAEGEEKAADEKCQKKIEALEESKKELEEKHLRAVADMQNIRRRSEEEKIKARKTGSVDVLKSILTVVDTFSRAFDHIPAELEKNTFVEGLQNVQQNFLDALTQMGVEFFGAAGEDFDEKKHDSMMLDPSTEAGKIAQVFETGVMFKGEILRHAKVSVGQ